MIKHRRTCMCGGLGWIWKAIPQPVEIWTEIKGKLYRPSPFNGILIGVDLSNMLAPAQKRAKCPVKREHHG